MRFPLPARDPQLQPRRPTAREALGIRPAASTSIGRRRGLARALASSVAVHALVLTALLASGPTPPEPTGAIIELGLVERPGAAAGAVVDDPGTAGPSGADAPSVTESPGDSGGSAPTPQPEAPRPEPPTPRPEPPAQADARPPPARASEGRTAAPDAAAPALPEAAVSEAAAPEGTAPDAAALEALAALAGEAVQRTDDSAFEDEPTPRRPRAPGRARSIPAAATVDEAGPAAVEQPSSAAPVGAGGATVSSDAGGPSGAAAPSPGGAEASALAIWQTRVRAHLMRLFRPPPAAGRTELSCRVHLWIDPWSGEVQRAVLAESSGVDAWDRAALRAVESADYLPAPPAVAVPLLGDGFDVRFVPP